MSKEAQDLAEQLLGTLQAGAVEEAVPSTGLYCLVLALTECTHVDVYGMGVGTIKKTDLSDLEYFKVSRIVTALLPHLRLWSRACLVSVVRGGGHGSARTHTSTGGTRGTTWN
jgi:hypothetical protein